MGGSTIYVLIMQNGLSPQSKRKWNENYSGRLLKKSRLRMALVVVERILNEEGGWNWFRCCCVFEGSPVSYYMRTHVESVHSMYIVRKRKRMLATEKTERCQNRGGTDMPPTWSRALSSHHHVKVLAAPPRMPPSTWLRRLRPCVLLFPRARSFRAGASLRVVVRTICLTVWLLGASVHLGKETFLTALIVQTSNMAWHP